MKFKAIHTKAEYEKAVALIDALMDKDDDDSAAMEELEVWAILVEAYEEEHFPIEAPTVREALEFAFEQRGWGPSDRVKIFGSKSRMSEFMNGIRGLSPAMMRRAHFDLGVPAEVLLLDTASGKFSASRVIKKLRGGALLMEKKAPRAPAAVKRRADKEVRPRR